MIIQIFYISSFEYYDKIEERVKFLSTYNNARAYIRLNVRDYKKCSLQMLKKTADLILSEEYHAVKTAYDSVCGEFHFDNDKKWIVDIDKEYLHLKDDVKNKILNLYHEFNMSSSSIKVEIPTKNGLHLITNPFPLDKFKKEYPDIHIHKDNPTILFCL